MVRPSFLELATHHAPRTTQHVRPMMWELACDQTPNPYSFRFKATSSVVVDWGDGTGTETWSPWETKSDVETEATHVYEVPATYTVRLYGPVQWVQLDGCASNDSTDHRILRCLTFGNLPLTSLERTFCRLTHLTSVPDHIPRTVRDLTQTFRECSSLDDANVSEWNTENVQVMDETFAYASKFNQNLNGWNTDRVRSMQRMFFRAERFNGDVSSWNTERVEYMNEMFQEAYVFDQNIGGWLTGQVVDMSGMFEDACAFDQPIGEWDTRNVVNMERMFANAESFDHPIQDWNVRGVRRMESMFDGACAYQRDLSSWTVSNIRFPPHRFDRRSPIERHESIQPRWGCSN